MKRLFPKILAVLLLCLLMPNAQAATLGAGGNPDNFNPTKVQIADKWYEVTEAETLYVKKPSVSAPYAVGQLSDSHLQSGITYLNYIRYVAKLPQVQLNAQLNEDAQYGAVLLAAVDTLSHYPGKPADMDTAFYERGYSATSTSNIAFRQGLRPLINLQDAISGCMSDFSSLDNLSVVGHRRWLMNPALLNVGFGYADSKTGRSYITTKVFDTSGTGCDYEFISWPAAGNHPTNLFDVRTPWSVTLNPQKYQVPRLANLKITLTREADKKTWTFHSSTGKPESYNKPYLTVDQGGYGVANCIIFHPGANNLDDYYGVYTVNITGLSTKDGKATTLNYQVDFFDVEAQCLDYVVENDEVTITGCKRSDDGRFTIPNTIEGCPVTMIGNNAFANALFRAIDIPTGVTQIGNSAFYGCSNLAEVTLPKKLTRIGKNAFSGSGLESVTLPSTVAVIEEGTFRNCARLATVTLLNGVTRVDDLAFADCPQLKNFSFSGSITDFGSKIFENDTQLNYHVYDNGRYLGNADNPYLMLVAVSDKEITSCEIASRTRYIYEDAFRDCVKMTQVTLPNTVLWMGSSAFRGCTALQNAKLPWDLKKLPEHLFRDCTALTEIRFPAGATDIGSNVFTNCVGLTKLTIPQGVATIGDGGFYGCHGLKTLELPDALTKIGSSAFYACKGLQELVLPKNLLEIGSGAFSQCDALKKLYFCGNAPKLQADGKTFANVTAHLFYHTGTQGWAEVVNKNYGGTLTWMKQDHLVVTYKKDSNQNCTTDGTERGTCLACGAVDVRPAVGSALGHSLTKYYADNNATCTKDGTRTATCNRCGEKQTQTIPGSALGHSFTKYYSDNNATCTADGTQTATCDRCSEKKTKPNYGTALGHSFTKYYPDNNATCTANGTQTATCDRCSEKKTKGLGGSALGHSFTKYYPDHNATCTANGTQTATCDRCSEKKTKGLGGSALGHSFTKYYPDNNATCTKDGTQTATCDRCSEKKTKSDPGSALGHRFVGGLCIRGDAVTSAFTGLVHRDDGDYYVVKGQQSTTTGLVKYDGIWYYLKNGRVAVEVTNLVKYGGEWWYVVKGKIASDKTELVKFNGELFYIVKGKLAAKTTTLVKYQGSWYYIYQGKFAAQTTTLVKYNGEWFYVVNGKVASDTTTLVYFNGGWYYLFKGKLAAKTTTLVKYNGVWYYVENGKVNFGYTGTFRFNGGAYQIKNGKIA